MTCGWHTVFIEAKYSYDCFFAAGGLAAQGNRKIVTIVKCLVFVNNDMKHCKEKGV